MGWLRSVAWIVGVAACGAATLAWPDAPSDDETRALVALRLIVPVSGVPRASLRDTYDDVRGSAKHEAIDIPAARGTPIVAATDGRVVKLFHSVPGGITIYQFDPAARFALYYAHLDAYAPDVREGAMLARGQVIGYVGATGYAPPDAPHLHFALFRLGPQKQWWKGTPLDPYPFLHDPEH
jgi:murein DD-endopeptidase MepM/ murein hydrolase activator NlpD